VFFQFQFVIDCNELRLSVTMTTLTIFNEYTRYNAWRMAKNFSFFSAMYMPQPARVEVFDPCV